MSKKKIDMFYLLPFDISSKVAKTKYTLNIVFQVSINFLPFALKQIYSML